MSLEQLTERILEQAREEANSILEQAREEAARIERDAKAEAKTLEEELGREAARRAETETQRLLSQARLEERLKVIEVRQEAFAHVLNEVRSRLEKIGKEERIRLYQGFLQAAHPDGDEEIVPAASERSFFSPDVVSALNQGLEEKGWLKLSPDSSDIPSGFVLRKGKRTDVCSIETALERLREQLEPEIVQTLFGGENR
jgi:V/A-type H+-transporting ATPase subunit E